MAELPDIDGGFESDKIRKKFIDLIYANKGHFASFFNKDLRGTNATINALQGFTGNPACSSRNSRSGNWNFR